MPVQILKDGFGEKFNALLNDCTNELLIISPFIKEAVASRVATHLKKSGLKCVIITRFYMDDFYKGVSDLSVLEKLMNAGAEIYALQDLHSKLYIFGTASVISGSFNFTFGGFYRNHEFGVLMENEQSFTAECTHYFNELLRRMKASGSGKWLITQDMIDMARQEINEAKVTAKSNKTSNGSIPNKRFGAKLDDITRSEPAFDLGHSKKKEKDFLEAELKRPIHTGCWIKFEGSAKDRIKGDTNYWDRRSSWYSYPDRIYFRRRPKGIQKGDIVFIAAVSEDQRNKAQPMIVGYGTVAGFKENQKIDAKIISLSQQRAFILITSSLKITYCCRGRLDTEFRTKKYVMH